MSPSNKTAKRQTPFAGALDSQEDRRRFPRYPCRFRLRMLRPNGEVEQAIARDLSATGIRLYTQTPLQSGDRLPIILRVFDGYKKQHHDIYALTNVAYCVYDHAESCFRLGLHITQFSGDGEALFAQTVERLANPWVLVKDPYQNETSFRLRKKINLRLGAQMPLIAWTERVSHSTLGIKGERTIDHQGEFQIDVPIMLPNEGIIQSVDAKARVYDTIHGADGSVTTTLKILSFDGEGRRLFHEELRQRFGIDPPTDAHAPVPASMLEPIGPWDHPKDHPKESIAEEQRRVSDDDFLPPLEDE